MPASSSVNQRPRISLLIGAIVGVLFVIQGCVAIGAEDDLPKSTKSSVLPQHIVDLCENRDWGRVAEFALSSVEAVRGARGEYPERIENAISCFARNVEILSRIAIAKDSGQSATLCRRAILESSKNIFLIDFGIANSSVMTAKAYLDVLASSGASNVLLNSSEVDYRQFRAAICDGYVLVADVLRSKKIDPFTPKQVVQFNYLGAVDPADRARNQENSDYNNVQFSIRDCEESLKRRHSLIIQDLFKRKFPDRTVGVAVFSKLGLHSPAEIEAFFKE